MGDLIILAVPLVLAYPVTVLRDRWNERQAYALVQGPEDSAPRVVNEHSGDWG